MKITQKDAGRVGIFGTSGSGKSAFVKQKLKALRRVVVYDPQSEYVGDGFKVVTSIKGVQAAMAADLAGFKISYQPPSVKHAESLSVLCWMLYRAQDRYAQGIGGAEMFLVVEEMNLSYDLHGADKCTGFSELVSRGRNAGINVIGVSQRIQEVATRFRGNLTECVILHMSEERDHIAAAGALRGTKEQCAALPILHWLHRDRTGAINAGQHDFSGFKTVRKTPPKKAVAAVKKPRGRPRKKA